MQHKLLRFDEHYYKEVAKKYRYGLFEGNEKYTRIGELPESYIRKKFACHDNAPRFLNLYHSGRKSIITTGIGLSGLPHLGTIAQILNMIMFQKEGFNVQIVLADLDACNSRNISYDIVKPMVEKYRRFILNLGFDVQKGILRSQSQNSSVLLTGYVISNHITDADFETTKEDALLYYKKKNIYSNITFPIKISIVLMLADFLNLVMRDGYSNVMVMLGVDEHRYVRLAIQIARRLRLKGNFSAIYSKILAGLDGFPKMSKSIPECTISPGMSEHKIKKKLLVGDSHDALSESQVFDIMCLASYYTVEQLEKVQESFAILGESWNAQKKEYIRSLINILEKWDL